MRKCGLVLSIFVISVALASGIGATPVFPTVTFDYEPSSWTYTYTVTVTPNDTYPFGYFQVDTLLRHATDWQIHAYRASDMQPLNWVKGFKSYSLTPPLSYGFWLGLPEDEVFPQNIPPGEVWQGYFIIVAPNTIPLPGKVLTKDGVTGENILYLDVPAIPEPASIAGLTIGIAGLVGIIRRRKYSS